MRELEQGKKTVRMDKVNVALSMFGMEAVPGSLPQTRRRKRGIDDGFFSTAYVYVRNTFAGELQETEAGYRLHTTRPTSLPTAPASSADVALQSSSLEDTISFFDGLILKAGF